MENGNWRNITRQCSIELEFSGNEALAYLWSPDHGEKIGLFDRSGFHYMHQFTDEKVYRVVSGYPARDRISWFQVHKKVGAE